MADGTGAFRPLTGIYEPSAIVQLADGRFLVVEDEKDHPFALLTLSADGPGAVAVPERDDDGPLSKLSDLEGLAVDPAGRIVAVTSHSRTSDGDEKKSRQKLVRFRVAGDRLVDAVATGDLKAALVAAHPALAVAAEIRDVKGEGGLNIEAIEFRADGKALLVGLRSPLLDGRAVVAVVEDPAEVFDPGGVPVVSGLLALDLDGRGIRSLAHVPALGGYLVVGGPVARDTEPFGLWFWSGGAEPPRRAVLPGLPGFEHAEGICAAVVAGRPCLVVVSDDGDRAAGRPARYLQFDPAALRIDRAGGESAPA